MEGGAAVDARTFQTEALKIEKLLYHISYAMLRNESDCEDAVQEAVLRAWQRLPGLQNPQFFETWLTRIVINECKSQLRRRSRRGETELSPQLAAPVSPEPELHAALTALKWKYRVVLTLKYIDGYTIEEIARILTLPRGTVASRLDQAKRLLRAQMKGEI